jgi:hypothetical protein
MDWLGMFDSTKLHRVLPVDIHRDQGPDEQLGLADCGTICQPSGSTAETQHTRCPECFPNG